MGCSGTDFVLADLPTVWPKYIPRVLRLPPKGVVEAVHCVASDTALALEGPDGLLIVSLTPREDAIELEVLLAVSTGTPGAFRRQEAAVCAIARDLGASAVVFVPARRGWDKVVGPEWITRGNAYVRQLHGRQE